MIQYGYTTEGSVPMLDQVKDRELFADNLVLRPSEGNAWYRFVGFLVDHVEMGLTAAGPVLKRRPRKVPRSAWFRLRRSDRRNNMLRWWL